jgi:hypothetical protein
MGYSIDLFQGTVDDELICPICMEVFIIFNFVLN